jgi:L-cystine uptake protein TcyP (sodium:dicarboxylate symporter family)
VENELGVSNQISSIAIASFAAGVMGVYISINTLCDMGATCVNVIGDMAGCVVLQEKIDLK